MEQLPNSSENKIEIPLELQYGVEKADGNSEVYEAAIAKLQNYAQIQEKAGLSDRDMELLADSENPYRLKKFAQQDQLRLKEIQEKIEASNS